MAGWINTSPLVKAALIASDTDEWGIGAGCVPTRAAREMLSQAVMNECRKSTRDCVGNWIRGKGNTAVSMLPD